MSSAKFIGAIASCTLAFAAAASYAANVSELDNGSLHGGNRYDRCLELERQNPQAALDAAQAWYAAKGGAAALHCEALSLTQMRRYSEAAEKLDDAAHQLDSKSTAMHAALYDQAGNAWMLAANPQKAIASLSAALTFSPSDTDILTDRARAKAEARDWVGAEADLGAILALDPDRADVYVLRASARHAEGRRAEADSDIAHALAIYPGYPEALVERGSMKFEAGDQAGARADWQQVLAEAPDSDAGAAARQHLAEFRRPVPH